MEDIAELLQFIGNEFMMWLWFKCDCFEGLLPIPGHGEVEVIFDSHLLLTAYIDEALNVSRSDLKGDAPAYSPEAKIALQQGKRIAKAKIRLIKEGREWSFSLTGSTMDYSGIKIPAVLSKDDSEQFIERIYLIEELEEMIEILYQEFLRIRIRPTWYNFCVPAMKQWITRTEPSTPKDYPEILTTFTFEDPPKITLQKDREWNVKKGASLEEPKEENESQQLVEEAEFST